MINRREAVLSLLDESRTQEYIPAGFFIHFDKSCHRGQASIDKHLEYYRYTGMDFVKMYYRFSPPLAEFIARHEELKALTRTFLKPIVQTAKAILHEKQLRLTTENER